MKLKNIGQKLYPQRLRKFFTKELDKAGLEINTEEFLAVFTIISIFVAAIITVVRIYPAPVITLIFTFIIFIPLSTAAVLVLVHGYMTVRIYNRVKHMEEVFPNYLQLAASNIRSGMMIDKALWLAIRPRFGMLAKEMETVAKKSMAGEEITDALKEFGDKYDSELVKRSVGLLVDGMESGGKIAELLNKISWSIREAQITRKEMAANVTTYVIFISFTVLAAAPFLYGLGHTLLLVMSKILPNLQNASAAGMSIGGRLGITPEQFTTFAITALSITSLMSAMIVSTIQKGSIKAGIKYVPVFVTITVLLFLIAKAVLGMMFGGLF